MENRICISGRGMVSSLGLDVNTSCAAARSGVVRSSELDHFLVRMKDSSIKGVIGHAVPFLTEGFEGDARLLRLTYGGLVDLKRQMPQAPWEKAMTAFYLSFPKSNRRFSGLDLILNVEERNSYQKKVSEADNERADDDKYRNLLFKALRLSNFLCKPEFVFVTTLGNAGVAEAISRAINDLQSGKIKVAIVGGVDSFIDIDTLSWLINTGRLKSEDNPVGLQPGEASAFIVLETLRSSRSTNYGIIDKVLMGQDKKNFFSSDFPVGNVLANLIIEFWKTMTWEDEKRFWLISNNNGEHHNAYEYGNIQVQLISQNFFFRNLIHWHPVVSFGETGAATGAVAIIMAINAFDRGYQISETATIALSSDNSHRAAIFLKKA